MCAKGRGPDEAQDRLSVLLHASIRDDSWGESEPRAEEPDFLRRQAAAVPQNLRQRGMIRPEVTRKRPERITRIATAALLKLGPESLAEGHGATLCGGEKSVNRAGPESGANPSARLSPISSEP